MSRVPGSGCKGCCKGVQVVRLTVELGVLGSMHLGYVEGQPGRVLEDIWCMYPFPEYEYGMSGCIMLGDNLRHFG